MKYLKPFLSIALLALLPGNALAELELIKRVTEPFSDAGPYQKLVSDDGRTYWIRAHIATSLRPAKFSHLALEGFFDGKSVGRVELDDSPIFFPLGQPQSLVTTGNGKGEWRAVKLNKELTKVEKTAEFKSMLGVTGSARVEDGYIVAGGGKDKMAIESLGRDVKPIIVKLDKSLKTVRELRIPDKGRVNSLFTQAGKIYAVLDYEQKPSEMLELSPNLSIVKKYQIPTGLVTGIPLRDGGFAITYTAVPTMDVMIEKLDANAKSLWKKKLFTRKGISSMLYTLCELPHGLAFVGKRDDRLLVARIDADGQTLRITEDTRTGLRIASSDPYLVGVQGDEIHVRGVAQNLDGSGSQTVFHFVETP